MATLCLLHQIGTKIPTRVVQVQDLQPVDMSKVYFCVQSDCEAEAQAVAYSVKAINDTFKLGLHQVADEATGVSLSIMEPDSWYQESWCTGDRYLYLYAASSSMEDALLEPFRLWAEKNIFYVGEGQGDELYALMDQASSKLDELLCKQPESLDMHLVQRSILGAGKSSARNMVRKVAFFSGDHGAPACSAAKHYLINHLYGLANQKEGNAYHGACKWICRPKETLPNTSEWHSVLSTFMQTQA